MFVFCIASSLCWIADLKMFNRSMEQSRGEADNRSASPEVSRCVCNPRFHYRVYKSPPLDPVHSQLNPICTFTPYIFKINYNIIHQSVLRFLKQFLTFWFSIWNFVQFLIAPMRDTCSNSLLHIITLITLVAIVHYSVTVKNDPHVKKANSFQIVCKISFAC
jgi:hypothetical protein